MNPRCPEIERFLSEHAGLAPESLGRMSIAAAVRAAMKAAGIGSTDDYLAALRSGRESPEALLDRVVVPETWFFRDKECFNYLKIYLGEKGFPGNGTKPVRLLSAPCSTGEEPYSIAMALLEMGISAERFRIDAVDISAKSIAAAERAVYGRGSFREEGRGAYERYFSKTEEGLKLHPRVAGLIRFHRENLALPHALRDYEPYDIIFCKNLLIYLTETGREAVIANIDRLLVPDGLLFAGNSEVFAFQDGFTPVKHARSFACRKTEKALAKAPAAPQQPPEAPAEKERRVRAAPKTAPAASKRKVFPEPALPVPASMTFEEIKGLADKGELHEALRLCGEFLESSRHHVEGYCLMGLINFALNSFAAAEEFFQRALYLDPHHYEALTHMSLLYEKKGDRAKASVVRRRIERFRKEGADMKETRS